MAHVAGNTVGQGFYWSPLSGEHVDVAKGERRTLHGDADTTFYRVPALLMLCAAPIIGLVFVVFLPVIGIVLTVDAVASRLFAQGRRAADTIASIATPSALPGHATLTTKRDPAEREADERAAEVAEERALAEEIARRRGKGER